jgi:hypothetical protein
MNEAVLIWMDYVPPLIWCVVALCIIVFGGGIWAVGEMMVEHLFAKDLPPDGPKPAADADAVRK